MIAKMLSRRPALMPVVVVLAVVMLAAAWFAVDCGIFGSKPLETMTKDQATARLEEHIQRAVDSLANKPRLEPSGDVIEVSCDDVPALMDRHGVERTFWLRDLSITADEVYVALRSYWAGHGYKIVRQKGNPIFDLTVAHLRDKFALGLQRNVQGDLYISASSPCIIKN